jgi:phosphoenolpyruvate-protein kinase (PTS system EI component)
MTWRIWGAMRQALAGIRTHALEDMPPDSVLVATRLLPSDTVHLSRKSVVAIVSEFGGPASHAALLTREMGIPAVTHVSAASDAIAAGATVLVDGFTGTVVVAPDAETQAEFEKRMAEQHVSGAAARGRCREPATTLDGVATMVMANIGCREDAPGRRQWRRRREALSPGTTLFVAQSAPTEDELLEIMHDTVEPLAGKPITIRLLDVGADEVASIDLRSSEPVSGAAGRTVLWRIPNCSNAAPSTCSTVGEHDVHILVPMVTLAEEMKSLRELLMVAAAHVGVKRLPPLGAMIETPAAALCVVELVQHADFLSLGTNDLTQYTMAAGREDPLVSDYFRDDHPAVRRLLGLVAEAVGDTPLALCGELAGRLDMLPFLLATGIHSFSVAPPLVPSVKETIRGVRVN